MMGLPLDQFIEIRYLIEELIKEEQYYKALGLVEKLSNLLHAHSHILSQQKGETKYLEFQCYVGLGEYRRAFELFGQMAGIKLPGSDLTGLYEAGMRIAAHLGEWDHLYQSTLRIVDIYYELKKRTEAFHAAIFGLEQLAQKGLLPKAGKLVRFLYEEAKSMRGDDCLRDGFYFLLKLREQAPDDELTTYLWRQMKELPKCLSGAEPQFYEALTSWLGEEEAIIEKVPLELRRKYERWQTISEYCRKGDLTKIKQFIRSGYDIDCQFSIGGASLLIAAAAGGHRLITEFLIREGANLDLQDWQGQTALAVAVNMKNPIIAKILLKAGADPTIRNRFGRSAVHIAALNRLSEVLRMMVGSPDVDIDKPDNFGYPPLTLAVKSRSENVVRVLMNHGANPDACGPGGCTPLIMAARDGQLELVKLLVSCGADPDVCDHQGFTAEKWASLENQPLVDAYLKNYRAGYDI